MPYNHLQRGISIIEVIVVAAIVAIFFSGLFASFYYTISLIQDSKARQTALSVAHNQMEFIRSLSYDAVGTVAGIPPGNIPQVATTTLNGINFTVRTLIEYVDDPADGLGAADLNGITTDYKTAKVTINWESRGVAKELFLVSRVIPRSIETDVGGGTLRVNVYDADVQPLSGATVRLTNIIGTTTIDVTRTTNANGEALFGGAPAGAGYEVVVSRADYSTDGTQAITTELVNPATPPASVAEADITTLNFFIDELSSVTINTVGSRTYGDFVEDFVGTSTFATSSQVTVVSDELVLEQSAGLYVLNGYVDLLPITPASLVRWERIVVSETIPGLTARTIQLFTNEATPVLLPDSDLPGNSTGLTANSIDLSMLDPVAYPSLVVRINLETADTNETPRVGELMLEYVSTEASVPNVTLDIVGNKSLGTNASSSAVYKFSTSTATDSDGELVMNNMEWDTYRIEPSGYSIVEACPQHPLSVLPGTSQNLTLQLATFSPQALRVVVTDSASIPQADIEVRLERPGYDETNITSPCGQTSFLGLSIADNYELSALVDGVSVWSQSDISINGQQVTVIQLP